MSLGQIIRKRREEIGLTLDEVSMQTGFSKPYLSTVETGKVKNPPSDNLLSRLERTLEFEPGLLQHIAHLERMPADIRHDYETADAENRKLRRILRQIVQNKAGPEQLGEMLAQNGLNVEPSAQKLAAGMLVPIINKTAAGLPVDFDDMGYPVGFADEYVRCPDLHDPNAFAVRVIGDSMEPKFVDGDIVIFSPAAEVHNGDDCYVRFAQPHECTFKRVFFEQEGKVRLQPRNERYAPTVVEGKRINGVYRAVMRYERL